MNCSIPSYARFIKECAARGYPTDKTVPIECVQIKVEDGRGQIVATDGKRLFEMTWKAFEWNDHQNGTVLVAASDFYDAMFYLRDFNEVFLNDDVAANRINLYARCPGGGSVDRYSVYLPCHDPMRYPGVNDFLERSSKRFEGLDCVDLKVNAKLLKEMLEALDFIACGVNADHPDLTCVLRVPFDPRQTVSVFAEHETTKFGMVRVHSLLNPLEPDDSAKRPVDFLEQVFSSVTVGNQTAVDRALSNFRQFRTSDAVAARKEMP